MTPENLVKAIERATDGTYVLNGYTTAMHWVPKFDELGRIITANPNITTSFINIDNKNYMIKKCGWNVAIYEDDQSTLVTTVDLTPDYLK